MRHAKTRKRSGWRVSTVVLVAVLVVGLCVLLYPTVSDWWNRRVQSRVIDEYDEAVAAMAEEDREAMLDRARAYNEALREVGSERALIRPDLVSGYEGALDVTGTGVMGYIAIDELDVRLPVYHGTSDDVLAVGAGHLEGSSLPIGEEGAHAVISAHRGLPSSLLFTDVDRLEVGDVFTVTVLGEVLTYEVDDIAIVEPTDFGRLYLVDGEDLCTLMTCTPYGVNTHRLLVRGHRVAGADALHVTADAQRVSPLLVAVSIMVPLAAVVCVAGLLWGRRRNGRKRGTL